MGKIWVFLEPLSPFPTLLKNFFKSSLLGLKWELFGFQIIAELLMWNIPLRTQRSLEMFWCLFYLGISQFWDTFSYTPEMKSLLSLENHPTGSYPRFQAQDSTHKIWILLAYLKSRIIHVRKYSVAELFICKVFQISTSVQYILQNANQWSVCTFCSLTQLLRIELSQLLIINQ